MRQERKKREDDDAHSVISEARSQRSMVIDGGSVKNSLCKKMSDFILFFSEDVIEEVVVNTMEQAPMQLVRTLVIVHRNDSNIRYNIYSKENYKKMF